MLKQDVFSTPEFKAQSKYFVFCHIDAEKQTSVAQQFGVSSYPDIRFIRPDGTEVHRAPGFRPTPQFVAEMDKARGGG